MPVVKHIAHFQGRRDEVPNQELARSLASKKDRAGVREIADNLWHKNKNVQADCIKVLYEVGYIDPGLIAPHADDFVLLLKSKNNRLVWGGMTALATIAEKKPDAILDHLPEIKQAMQEGSAITVDSGVLALARAASRGEKYSKAMLPLLLQHLKTCRPKDVPQHAEKTLAAVDAANRAKFAAVLTKRMDDLSGAGLVRVKKVIKLADAT